MRDLALGKAHDNHADSVGKEAPDGSWQDASIQGQESLLSDHRRHAAQHRLIGAAIYNIRAAIQQHWSFNIATLELQYSNIGASI